MTSRFPVALLLLLALTAGCGESAPESAKEAVTARDSAGVRVIEVPGSHLTSAPPWTVPDTPRVEIGVVDGSEAYQLGEVRDALRLPDGRIAVANGSPPEIRLFTPDGEHVVTLGREGEGPGEFRSLSGLAHAGGDTVAVLDVELRRITRFTATGPAGSKTVPRAATRERTFPLATGSWILRTWPEPPGGWPAGRSGPVWFRSAVVRVDPAARSPDTVQLVDGPRVIIDEEDKSRGTESLYGHDSHVFGSDSTVWVGDSRRAELRGYAPDGRLRRVLRVAERRRAATDEAVDSLVERRLVGVEEPERRESLERRLREDPRPEVLPAFYGIERSAGGRLWVALNRPSSWQETVWTALEPDGGIVARLRLPPRFEPYEFGADHVLGVWTDELGVEHVRMYRLNDHSR